jgi:hypothetical protein
MEVRDHRLHAPGDQCVRFVAYVAPPFSKEDVDNREKSGGVLREHKIMDIWTRYNVPKYPLSSKTRARALGSGPHPGGKGGMPLLPGSAAGQRLPSRGWPGLNGPQRAVARKEASARKQPSARKDPLAWVLAGEGRLGANCFKLHNSIYNRDFPLREL